MLLLGNGMEPKIAIAAVVCFFPTLVNMVRGLESVNPQSMELMKVLSASKTEIFFKLRLLNSVPYLFSALKIAASTAVIGAIVGEWIGSNTGIGALIIQSTYNFDSAMLYATVIVGSAFSVAFFLAITLIERLVIRWQPLGCRLNGDIFDVTVPTYRIPNPPALLRSSPAPTWSWSAADRPVLPRRSRRGAKAARSR